MSFILHFFQSDMVFAVVNPFLWIFNDFLTTLNSLHPSKSFIMNLPVDNKIGIEIIKNRTKIDTQLYRKPAVNCIFQATRTSAIKSGLLKTMNHRAYALSSTTEAFNQECTRLRSIFTLLDYPLAMINSTITKTIQSFSFGTREKNKKISSIVRVTGFVPFFRNKFPGLFQDSDWFFKGSKIHINPYTLKIAMLILFTAFHLLHIF